MYDNFLKITQTPFWLCLILCGELWAEAPLEKTTPLEMQGDLAAQMVSGLHRDLDRRTTDARSERKTHWSHIVSAEGAREEKRSTLTTILGAVAPRLPASMETLGRPGATGPVAESEHYAIFPVRWPVVPGVWGEGFLVEPHQAALASVVVLPDADELPETIVGLGTGSPLRSEGVFRLATAGCRILILSPLNREDTWSGHPDVRMTNQPHREFLYRGAYEMGRHPIGYEVLTVSSAIDWIESKSPGQRVGLMGYGEGGLVALHAAAIDTRVDATVVSGYFGPREGLWEEPIYRNVWSLLKDFGDAEVAALIAPRTLLVEDATPPTVSGPPLTAGRPHGAAPGVVPHPTPDAVQAEVARAQAYYPAGDNPAGWLQLMETNDKLPGQPETFETLAQHLGISELPTSPATQTPAPGHRPDPAARMERQVKGWLAHTKHVMEEGQFVRKALWEKADATSVDTWVQSTAWYRNDFHETVIGKLPEPTMDPNARSRQVYETDAFIGYEVVLDVYADVFAYGILLVPKGIPEGEQRPVVVCQHGLEGRPQDVADPNNVHKAYDQYGCRLAEEGFIVYAPQNPYIGKDHFRSAQRKANPLGLSLFSYIIAQHDQTLDWLGSLPFVDPDRIAFYGLSYGGKTAMRVPAILEGYCLSICSGDYNEWIWKNVTTRQIYSYMFHGEYEMFEWNMGNTYNYAEMSWLICPRPFMVERGHHDGVAPDEWVGYEYARTQRRYDLLGIGENTTIEWFDGPHKINGVGTFEFLRKHLKHPKVK